KNFQHWKVTLRSREALGTSTAADTARCGDFLKECFGESGFTDAGLTGECDQTSVTVSRGLERAAERAQFLVASDDQLLAMAGRLPANRRAAVLNVFDGRRKAVTDAGDRDDEALPVIVECL